MSADNQVSELMSAIYQRDKARVDELLAEVPTLNLFECAALGRTAQLPDDTGVSDRAPDGFTALHLACFFAHADTARELIARGADVNARNNRRDSALRLAAEGGHTEIVGLLLKSGANVNASTEGGKNSLISAAFNGHVEIGRLLISHNAQISPAISMGETPLHFAATFGHVEFVRLLIQHKADVNALTTIFSAETPLDRASNPEIIHMIRAAGGKKASELR